jgi:cyclopropane-fatty-acyl-phospholipid synthase
MVIQGSDDNRADILSGVLRGLGTACELEFPGGEVRRFGDQSPAFRVIFKNRRALRTPLTQYALARAYVENDIDLEGDMLALFDLRERLREPLSLLKTMRFAGQLFLQSPRLVNSRSVSQHYSFGDDFYLTYIDQRFRFYSQCLFRSDDESLEDASEHKLESMWNSLGLQPGMRLLDIGGGWGGVTEYCGARGVHVTTLTLAPDSANYIRNLIKEKDLPGEVFLQDVLDHEPSIPYDHAVIYGVIEHVPNYRQFCTRAWSFLKPGGRLYLDGAATKEKYRMSAFNRRYIWTGTHCFMALQDVVEELLFHGFEITEVRRETHDYELTMWHWAQRLDANREKIVELWGEEHYRAFHLFLWGGCHTFKTNLLQAYHLVAERRADPGPRPGNSRRLVNSLLALR